MDQAIRFSETSLHLHQLQPEPGGPRGDALDQRADLVGMQLDHGPCEQHHAVPHQPSVQRPSSLEGTDRLQHRHQHALELRQGDDATPFVAEGGQVADLGQGEQPLILRIGAGNPTEHIDVLG